MISSCGCADPSLDGAGMTDVEGVPQEASASEDDVVESLEAEVRFLHDELGLGCMGCSRRLEAGGPSSPGRWPIGIDLFLVDRLSGIGMTTIDANVIQTNFRNPRSDGAMDVDRRPSKCWPPHRPAPVPTPPCGQQGGSGPRSAMVTTRLQWIRTADDGGCELALRRAGQQG